MTIALLINDRALRAKLSGCFDQSGATIDEFPTAAKALASLVAKRYDVIVLHWKVHPGYGSGDARIEELAFLIPSTKLNRNLLYWEVGLRVIDLIRGEESANQQTPVITIFPSLGPSGFGIGDELSRESVVADMVARQPSEALYGPSKDEFAGAVQRCLITSHQ